MRHEVGQGFCAIALVLVTTSTAMAATEMGSGAGCQTENAKAISTKNADFADTRAQNAATASVPVDPAKSIAAGCTTAERSTFVPRVTPFLDETEESILFGQIERGTK